MSRYLFFPLSARDDCGRFICRFDVFHRLGFRRNFSIRHRFLLLVSSGESSRCAVNERFRFGIAFRVHGHSNSLDAFRFSIDASCELTYNVCSDSQGRGHVLFLLKECHRELCIDLFTCVGEGVVVYGVVEGVVFERCLS